MRHIILITTVAFIAGLFAAGQGLGAGEYEAGKASGAGSAQMEETQQQRMAAHPLDDNQVRELQKILKGKGFDAGAVDGIIGPRTQQALRDFQKSEGLTASGNPDKATLQALATDAKTQEVFGLSPEFGEKEEMQQKQPQEQKMAPEGAKPTERY
jgi:peptidoglycan hydrolase-like protein with peptidoglycan-binding domain